jgi:ADP-L-glycero-D-manno-heptose 6-epimerase
MFELGVFLNVLVTGGTGFIGKKIAERLLESGHSVFVTGSDGESGIPHGSELVRWDSVKSMRFDACFHQSANNDTLDMDLKKTMDENVFSPSNLFNHLAAEGCRKFVYASSAAVYGNGRTPYKESQEKNPLNAYAVSKLAFEEFASDFGVETKSSVVGLRYCNVYGPGECHKGRRASMVMHIINRMKEGLRPRIFRDGEQKRDWIYVEDVVEANISCLGFEGSGVFNVAGGRAVTFNYIVELINGITGKSLSPEYIECEFADRFQTNTECDISSAERELGWRPSISFEDGVEKYLSFLGTPL